LSGRVLAWPRQAIEIENEDGGILLLIFADVLDATPSVIAPHPQAKGACAVTMQYPFARRW